MIPWSLSTMAFRLLASEIAHRVNIFLTDSEFVLSGHADTDKMHLVERVTPTRDFSAGTGISTFECSTLCCFHGLNLFSLKSYLHLQVAVMMSHFCTILQFSRTALLKLCKFHCKKPKIHCEESRTYILPFHELRKKFVQVDLLPRHVAVCTRRLKIPRWITALRARHAYLFGAKMSAYRWGGGGGQNLEFW